MKFSIYNFGFVISCSLCCLFTPQTVTAQEIFLVANNFKDRAHKITGNPKISGIQSLDLNFTINATDIGKPPNHLKPNVVITNKNNVELQSLKSQSRTELLAKGGKKPPRKG